MNMDFENFKMNPFSYYNSNFSEKNSLDNENSSLNIEQDKINETDNINLIIEKKIKNKYKMLIPAIFMEIKNSKYFIEFTKEDLKNSLGEITHIEINGNIAYILYQNYISALLAYKIINQIVDSEQDADIIVKLIKNEENIKQQDYKIHSNSQSKHIIENIIEKNNFDYPEEVKGNNFIPHEYFGNRDFPWVINNKINEKNHSKPSIHFEFINSNTDELNSKLNNDQNSPFFYNNDKKIITNLVPEEENMKKRNIDYTFLENSETFQTEKLIIANKLKSKINEEYHNNSDFQSNSKLANVNNNNLNTNKDYENSTKQDNFNNLLIPSIANLDINSNLNNNLYMFFNKENKFVCNYEIQIDNDEYFRVTKRIIGNKGFYLKAILYDCCGKYGDYSTKIRLRGRGSGFKEGPNHEESNQPMQLCISSLNYNCYIKCCQSIEIFLGQIYTDFAYFIIKNNLNKNLIPRQIKKIEMSLNKFP